MSTGSTFVEITPNRLIETEDLKERFFDYLNDGTVALTGRVYDSPGVFGTPLTLDPSAAGELDILGSSLATDGIGHLLAVDDAMSYCQAVAYQDAAGVTYEISIRHNEAPWVDTNSIQNNPDSGAPEYLARQNFIGELGEPDDVQLIGNDIVLTIDSLCEAGVTHAGRWALVYLLTPLATTAAVGLPIIQIAYSGGQNKVTVLTNKLGQTDVSVTPAHYRVLVLGPTIRRNSSKVGVSGYVVLGSVTDDDADTSAQNPITVSLSNLNDAFNTFADTVAVDVASAGPKDSIPAALWAAASGIVYDGQIFSFGGITSYPLESAATGSIYAYDPSIDAWSTKVATIADAFTSHMAAAVVGDIVYIAGGHDGATATDTFRRYDPINDVFLSDGADLPAARHGGALVHLGGYLYYIGGDTAIAPAVSAQVAVYRYSIATDQWSAVADLPAARARVNAIADSSKLYVVGGSTTATLSNPTACYVYDPSSNAWASIANQPATVTYSFGTISEGAFFEPAIVLHNGAIHVIAGGGSETGALAFHQAYSIQANEWASLPAPQIPHTFGCSYGLVDGIVYLFGGVVRDAFDGTSHVSDLGFACALPVRAATADGAMVSVGLEERNASPAVITSLANLSVARTGCAVCPLGDGFLITGGADDIGGTYLASAEMYWPQTRTKCSVEDMPDARAFHGAVERGDSAIILSGRIEPTLADQRVTQFNPRNNTWAELTAAGEGPASYRAATVRSDVYEDVVFIVGGYDTTAIPIELASVEMWNLASHVSDGTTSYAETNIEYSAACMSEGTIFQTSGGKLRALSTIPLSSVMHPIRPVTLPSNINNGAMVAWDGLIYIYDPANGRIFEYDPKTYELNIVVTGLSARYKAGVGIKNGRMYLFGGSSLANLSNATTSVIEIVLPGVRTRESEIQPSNFTTGKQADTISFRAGDIYGALSWDASSPLSFVKMSAEI